ncbi:MAG: DUF3006 domain-containing protein [Limnochordia bacterium]
MRRQRQVCLNTPAAAFRRLFLAAGLLLLAGLAAARAAGMNPDHVRVYEPRATAAKEGPRAAVDRIVDGTLAVILIGPAGRERLVPLAELPAGTREGDWLVVGDGAPGAGSYALDRRAAARARARIAGKLEVLKARGCAVTCL